MWKTRVLSFGQLVLPKQRTAKSWMTKLGKKPENLKLQATSLGDLRRFSEKKIHAILIALELVWFSLYLIANNTLRSRQEKKQQSIFHQQWEDKRHKKQAKLMVNDPVVVMYRDKLCASPPKHLRCAVKTWAGSWVFPECTLQLLWKQDSTASEQLSDCYSWRLPLPEQWFLIV